jgi:aspartyl-tRNA(Asn)/glutamyl-tRNA(Gln) amidotransferase subunit A
MTNYVRQLAKISAGNSSPHSTFAIPNLQHCLDRIKEVEGHVSAFASLSELTVDSSTESSNIETNQHQPLSRIPIAIKDNICTTELFTSCGSLALRDYKAPYDATVVSRLKEAGAIIVGKTKCDEFAMGSSTETGFYGPCHNPHNLNYVAGGSSGGSAAAVASGEVPIALGSDTGGSIRQPAAFCGIVGLKPTYGRVSRYGLVAHASSLDQIGPMAQNVDDVEMVFQIIAGLDDRDSTNSALHENRISKLVSGQRRAKIAVLKEFSTEGIQSEIVDSLRKTTEIFCKEGVQVEEVSLPLFAKALPIYYVISTAEASANLARFDGLRYGNSNRDQSPEDYRSKTLGAEVKRRIMLGSYVLSESYVGRYYQRAQRLRHLMQRQMAALWNDYDAVLLPTTPTTAFELGAKTKDPVAMYLSDLCTIFVNLCGSPAISVPAGFDRKNLPIGMQLVAADFDEATLFDYGRMIENGWK